MTYYVGNGLQPKCTTCGNYLMPCTMPNGIHPGPICLGCSNHDHGVISDPTIAAKVTAIGVVLATKGVHAVIERATSPHIMIQNTDSGLVYQGPSTLVAAVEAIEHQAKEMP